MRWNEVQGAGQYRVHRQNEQGKWDLLDNTMNPKYNDTDAKEGKIYHYFVTAVIPLAGPPITFDPNNYKDFGFKGEVIHALSTPSLHPPVRMVEEEALRLQWTAVPDAERYAVYIFEAARQINTAALPEGQLIATDSIVALANYSRSYQNNFVWNVSGVKPGAYYYFMVRAENNRAVSSFSHLAALPLENVLETGYAPGAEAQYFSAASALDDHNRRFYGLFFNQMIGPWMCGSTVTREPKPDSPLPASTPNLSPSGILYVRQGAQGKGSSWSDAMGDLQQALRQVRPGQQIWVAEGIYRPTGESDRQASFRIPDGASLYGSFAGHERSPDQRRPENHPTILSGEIGRPGAEDNVYNVVTTHNVSDNTWIDGFIIAGGNANGMTRDSALRSGGGWLNLAGPNRASSPRIANCVFVNNQAGEGGGFSNLAREGKADPLIWNCLFVANKAELDGGAMLNRADGGRALPEIFHSVFRENQACYGGALLNAGNGERGLAAPLISQSVFRENISLIRRSSVFTQASSSAHSRVIIKDCRFEGEVYSTTEPLQSQKTKKGMTTNPESN